MADKTWDPFDTLSDAQGKRLEAYQELLLRFNQKVNLISADSEADFRDQHLRHCLTLQYRSFPRGAMIVDWGTGGGLPAIPLAIANPEATVYAVDSVGKKVRMVRTMARRLGLENCFPWHGRAEDWEGEVHYSVSRATAPLADLWQWHDRVALAAGPNEAAEDDGFWEPGLLCLKGGDLSGEIADLHTVAPEVRVEQRSLSALLGRTDAFWRGKTLVSVTRMG